MRSLPSVRTAALAAAALAATALAACAVDDVELGSATDELGRPPVTGTVDGWSIDVDIDQDVRAGSVRASVTFDDHGLGGVRSGGVCLVADLGLGGCETAADCASAAVAAGYPGTGGTPGWYHYCEPTGGAARPGAKQCWSRPGRQGDLCMVGPNALPGSTRSVERVVAGWPLLEDRPRAWTALACLAGTDPAGCGRFTRYVHVLDAPVVVPPLAATR